MVSPGLWLDVERPRHLGPVAGVNIQQLSRATQGDRRRPRIASCYLREYVLADAVRLPLLTARHKYEIVHSSRRREVHRDLTTLSSQFERIVGVCQIASSCLNIGGIKDACHNPEQADPYEDISSRAGCNDWRSLVR